MVVDPLPEELVGDSQDKGIVREVFEIQGFDPGSVRTFISQLFFYDLFYRKEVFIHRCIVVVTARVSSASAKKVCVFRN